MTVNEVLARADAKYFAASGAMAKTAPGGEVRAGGGLLTVATGAPLAWLNIAFATRRLDDPAAAVREAIAYFETRELAFILRMREGADPAFEHAAAECGVTYGGSLPGMVMYPLMRRGRRAQPPLDTLGVQGTATFEPWTHVQHAGFDSAPGPGRQVLRRRVIGSPDVPAYVCYVNDDPVGSALFLSHRTAGVYHVATVPGDRGRGYRTFVRP